MGVALPTAAVHHFPQLDVAEVGKELQPAQKAEALGIKHVLVARHRHFAVGHQQRQFIGKGLPSGRAVFRRLGQGFVHQRLQARRHGLTQRTQGRRVGVVNLVHQRDLADRVERWPARHQVVQHRRQTVHVGLHLLRPAVQLLGRHVGQRADAKDLGAVTAAVENAAEVGQLDGSQAARLIQLHQHVGRLDIAMDQAPAGDVVQRHRALEADLDDLLQ